MKTWRRIFVMAGAVLVFLGGGFSSAGASPPDTFTETTHGLVGTFVDVVPFAGASCEGGGAYYEITTVSTLVEHGTVFDILDDREHVTFTMTGRFEATPVNNPSLPDISGHFTQQGGFNRNGKTVNGTGTFSVRGTTEDGERISSHYTRHFNERPDGTVNDFFRCRD